METHKKITVTGVLSEGIGLGIKNAVSMLGATVLWLLTIWIPYLNVGTTIAMNTIPIELSKGKVISPLFIFDGKYRKYMGEYFTLIGLMYLAIIPALFFMIIPGIIISIGWSLAIYILLDKGVAPGEAMIRSNKATYGYKWTIFGVSFLLGLAFYVLMMIIFNIASGGFAMLLLFIIAIVYTVAALGCTAVIYRNLTAEAQPEAGDVIAVPPTSETDIAQPKAEEAADDMPEEAPTAEEVQKDTAKDEVHDNGSEAVQPATDEAAGTSLEEKTDRL